MDRRIAFLLLTKNGSSREVPLSTKAAQVLATQRQRNDTPSPFPVTPNGFRLAWDRLRSRACLSELRFHDLRHEAISRFFELGLNFPEVAGYLRSQRPKDALSINAFESSGVGG